MEDFKNINNLKKITMLRAFTGTLFIFSGLAKLFPITAFEMQFVQQGIGDWILATWFARAIIAFEIFLGLSFFQKNFLKKIFIPAAIILLIIFSLDLIRTIILKGFSSDCGCFGEIIVMTPLESLLKNFVLIAALIYLGKLIKVEKSRGILLSVSFLLISFFPVFLIFSPGKFKYSNNNINETVSVDSAKTKQSNSSMHDEGNLSITYSKSTKEKALTSIKDFSGRESVNLKEGENIIAVLSMACGDCYETAVSIGQLSRKTKLPPVYFLLWGDRSEVEGFFRRTKVQFQYKLLDSPTLSKLTDGFVPKVFLLNNGKILQEWNYKTFSPDKLRKAIAK